jgi:hypothetical protein
MEGFFYHKSKYFNLVQAFAEPKPLNRPFLINAGGSPRGKRFCAQHCDAAFLILGSHDLEGVRKQVRGYKDLAMNEFGRDIKVWCYSYVSVAETLEKAKKHVDRYAIEYGDDQACENIVKELGIQTGIFTPEQADQFRYHFKAGWAGFPLVGTPQMMVDHLGMLTEAGVDGVLVVDLPPEEAGSLGPMFKSHGLDPIFLIAPTSTPARIAQVGRIASGYVYYVSLKGVTGSGALNVDEVLSALPAIREATGLPVGVGAVAYDLSLAACAAFAVAPDDFNAALAASAGAPSPFMPAAAHWDCWAVAALAAAATAAAAAAAKGRDVRAHAQAMKRARLLFDTRLVQWSPR